MDQEVKKEPREKSAKHDLRYNKLLQNKREIVLTLLDLEDPPKTRR